MGELREQSKKSFENWLFTTLKVSYFFSFSQFLSWEHAIHRKKKKGTSEHPKQYTLLMLIHFNVTEIGFSTTKFFTIHWIKRTEKTFKCFRSDVYLSKRYTKSYSQTSSWIIHSNIVIPHLIKYYFLTLIMKRLYTSFWTK